MGPALKFLGKQLVGYALMPYVIILGVGIIVGVSCCKWAAQKSCTCKKKADYDG